jgi:glycosyltransferase involved in cell wall biosynthesis
MVLNLTVIIPAYNVDIYLEDCVNSILSQSILPQTILIINDGSTDNTEKIAQDLVYQNSICKLISIENSGMGAARNIGVNNSNTEFIYFIDSDDVLLPGLFYEFYENMIKIPLLDLFCFSGGNFLDQKQDFTLSDSTFVYRNSSVFDNGQTAFSTLIHENNFFCSPVLVIFRKNVLDWEIDGFLDIIHEDEEWTPRLFLHSGKTIVSRNKYYSRRIRRGSVTFKNESLKNLLGYYAAKKTLESFKFDAKTYNLISALEIRMGYLRDNIIKIGLVNRVNLFQSPYNFSFLDYGYFFLRMPLFFTKLLLIGIKRIFIKRLNDKF